MLFNVELFKNADVRVLFLLSCDPLLSGTVCSSRSLCKQQTRLQKTAEGSLNSNGVRFLAQVACTNTKEECEFFCCFIVDDKLLKNLKLLVQTENFGLAFSNCGRGLYHLPACHKPCFVYFSFLSHSTFLSVSFSPSFPHPLLPTLIVNPPPLPIPPLPLCNLAG